MTFDQSGGAAVILTTTKPIIDQDLAKHYGFADLPVLEVQQAGKGLDKLVANWTQTLLTNLEDSTTKGKEPGKVRIVLE